jgi:large subunit ribosomal protein L21
MRAVLKTGGKQYRVAANDVVSVEKIPAAVGDKIELGPLLMLQKEDSLIVDPVQLADSKVICQVLRQDRDKKVVVFKKKRRKNYRKTQGHRQSVTRMKVIEIISGNAEELKNGT